MKLANRSVTQSGANTLVLLEPSHQRASVQGVQSKKKACRAIEPFQPIHCQTLRYRCWCISTPARRVVPLVDQRMVATPLQFSDGSAHANSGPRRSCCLNAICTFKLSKILRLLNLLRQDGGAPHHLTPGVGLFVWLVPKHCPTLGAVRNLAIRFHKLGIFRFGNRRGCDLPLLTERAPLAFHAIIGLHRQ